jgi:hypothetical protein
MKLECEQINFNYHLFGGISAMTRSSQIIEYDGCTEKYKLDLVILFPLEQKNMRFRGYLKSHDQFDVLWAELLA